jgi:hypothetical protein
LLALDLAGVDDIVGQRHQTGLIAQYLADVGQAPDQDALRAAGLGQWRGQRRQVIAPVRPVQSLPDALVITVIDAAIMGRLPRTGKIFASSYAAIRARIHRKYDA